MAFLLHADGLEVKEDNRKLSGYRMKGLILTEVRTAPQKEISEKIYN